MARRVGQPTKPKATNLRQLMVEDLLASRESWGSRESSDQEFRQYIIDQMYPLSDVELYESDEEFEIVGWKIGGLLPPKTVSPNTYYVVDAQGCIRPA